jgi:hypothetical protein
MFNILYYFCIKNIYINKVDNYDQFHYQSINLRIYSQEVMSEKHLCIQSMSNCLNNFNIYVNKFDNLIYYFHRKTSLSIYIKEYRYRFYLNLYKSDTSLNLDNFDTCKNIFYSLSRFPHQNILIDNYRYYLSYF